MPGRPVALGVEREDELRSAVREVEVLKLVGATDGFVKKPFVVEGSLQGALGAAGAIALLAVLFGLVRGRLDGELASRSVPGLRDGRSESDPSSWPKLTPSLMSIGVA